MLKAEYSATDVQVNCLFEHPKALNLFIELKFKTKGFVRGIDWYSSELVLLLTRFFWIMVMEV